MAAVRASVERRSRVAGAVPAWVAHLALPVLVVGLLLGPMAFDRGVLGIDWFAHAWYIDHQGQALRHGLVPSLFAHNAAGVFDPHFAYYAGNVYALGGLLALLTGSATAAVVLLFAMAFACGYGGLYWLARQAGLSSWAAHAPGALLVSSAYYVATVYGGGLMEVVAVSALPLLAAAAWALARAERFERAPAAALAFATVLFTGSHNLSLAWGTTVLLVVGALVLALAPAVRAVLATRAAAARLALVMVPATLVNAWVLLPVIAYSSNTVISADGAKADQDLRDTMFLVKADRLLTFARGTIDDTIPYYVCALPLLAIAWIVVSLVLARARHRAPAFRIGAVLLAVIAVLSIVAGSLGVLLALPSPWGLLQLGYRLEAYVQLALGGAVIAALTLTRDRRWAWALLAVVLVSLAQGVQQATPAISPDVGPSFQRATIPYISPVPVQGAADYAEADVPLAQKPGGAPLRFDPRDPTAPVAVPPGAGSGAELRSNLVAAPTLVRVDGATITGRAEDGTAVLRLDDGATRVTASARHPLPVTAGVALSLLGLAALAAVLVLRPGARAPTSPPPRAAPGPRPRRR